MMELLHEAFSVPNFMLSILLLVVFFYWIMVIFGALDADLFNIEFDTDVDLDFDVDVDVDVDIDGDFEFDVDGGADGDLGGDIDGGGIGRGVLEFFYVGEVPVMILISALILCMWAVSMIANYRLNPTGSMILALPLFAGNLIVSLMVCKVFIMPFKKMFSSLNKDANASRPVMGRICTVVTTQVSEKMGQAEMSSKGAPILINVVTDGGKVFHKGDEAVVIGKNVENGVYTIAPVDLE
jgi:hypothetical protein